MSISCPFVLIIQSPEVINFTIYKLPECKDHSNPVPFVDKTLLKIILSNHLQNGQLKSPIRVIVMSWTLV